MRTLLRNWLLLVALICSFNTYAQTTSIVETAGNSGNHNLLLAAVQASGISDILAKSGPFTVFAPSDTAFQHFSAEKLKELMNSTDKSKLKSLLSYHIVAGKLSASRILSALARGNGKTSFTTIQGKKVQVHMEGYDIILTDPLGNTARITQADVIQQNGIVHEIDSVIVPSKM